MYADNFRFIQTVFFLMFKSLLGYPSMRYLEICREQIIFDFNFLVLRIYPIFMVIYFFFKR